MNPNSPDEKRQDEKPFVLHQVIDHQHKGMVVTAFEYPAEWQAQSNVVWDFQQRSVPVIGYARTFNPRGTEALEFLPAESFFWTEPDYGLYQQGQNIEGQVFLQPMPAANVMTNWVVPKYRGNRPGLRIASVSPVQQLARRIGLNVPGLMSDDVCAKVEYSENGRLFEEEFYGMQTLQRVPYHGPQGTTFQINWGFVRLFSFRAEKGALDAHRETFWRVAGSVKSNPRWEQLCAQIMQQIQIQFNQLLQIGYSQIEAAGQLSRTISANNDAMLHSFEQQRQVAQQSDAARRAAERSNVTEHSPNDGFSDYMRGVETVDDPYYGQSQQDYNAQYHWTDGFGNYQHSNDPFFNPNVGSTQNWTIMNPKKS